MDSRQYKRKHEDEHSTFRGEFITEKEMNKVASRVHRKNRRRLARELEIPQCQIEEIEKKYSNEDYGEDEVCFQFLRLWSQSPNAVRDVLIEALRESGNESIIEELEENGKKTKRAKYSEIYEGPSTSKQIISEGNPNNDEFHRQIFLEISKRVEQNQWHLFGIELGFKTKDLIQLEKDDNIYQRGNEVMIFQMLEKWKQKENPNDDELVKKLYHGLITIERKDIAEDILKKTEGSILTPENEPKLLGKVQSYLRRNYSNYKILPRHMKETLHMPAEVYYVDLEIVPLSSTWEEQKNHPIKNLKNIFENVKHPILIEGNPGYGKTTFSYKLTEDWRNEASYICDRFDLLFYWSCEKNISRVEDIFMEHLKDMKDVEEKYLNQLIAKRKILLILDAFQEASEENKEKIFLYLKKDLSNITIMVTCRSGYINLKHRKLTDKYESSQYDQDCTHLTVWDTRLKITGFSDENTKIYLNKYFEDDENKLSKALCYIDNGNSELFKCPLYVLCLAKFINNGSGKSKTNVISNKTDLYKMIINTLVHQHDINNTENDIFLSENNIWKKGILDLVEGISENFKKDPFNIHLNSIPETLEKNNDQIKFLKKSLRYSDNKEIITDCKFIDESILHFFIAFHTHNLEIIKIEEEIKLFLQKLYPSNNILLYAFIAGFLQKKSNILFSSFVPLQCAINIFNDNFQNILFEIKNKPKNILEILKHFLNSKWFSQNVSSVLKEWYFELIKSSESLKELYLNICNDGDEHNYDYIPDNTYVESIIIDVDSKTASKIINLLKTKRFKIDIVEMFLKLDENLSFVEIKNLFKFLKNEQIALSCNFHTKALYAELQKNVIEKFIPSLYEIQRLNQLSLYYIHPNLFQSIIPEIKKFIKERKNFKELYIVLLPSDSKLNLKTSSFNEFFDTVSESSVKCFAFQHELEIELPLSKLLIKKSWEYLCLGGNFENKFLETTTLSNVKHLDCRGCYDLKDINKTKFVNTCKGVKKLTCFDSFIKNHGHDCIENMFETIEEIDVLLESDLECQWFNSFLKIKRILLTFLKVPEGYIAHELCEIVSNIRTIEIVEVYTLDENKYSALLPFVQQLKQNVSINEFHTNLQPDPDSVESFANELQSCFSRKILKKILIYFELDKKETLFIPSIAKYFFDKNRFKIISEECDDITFSKFPMLNRKLGCCNKLNKRICISAFEEFPSDE